MCNEKHNDSTSTKLYLDLTVLNPILYKLMDDLRDQTAELSSEFTDTRKIAIQQRHTLEPFISAIVDAYIQTGRPLDESYAGLNLRQISQRHERECTQLKKAARDWKFKYWATVLLLISTILLKLSF